MGTIASACWVLGLAIGGGGDGSDPLPGWVATCVGGDSGARPLTSLSEYAAFALQPGETFHPLVAPAGLHVAFVGDVKIARAGRYRFTIESGGGAALLAVVGDGEAKLASIAADGAPSKTTDWLALKAGTVRLQLRFDRKGDEPARVRTLWEMEAENQFGFAPEPIPLAAVSAPAEFRKEVERDLSAGRGRVLLTELGCVNCHAASGGAAAQIERRPPIALERVGARAHSDWLERWLADPQKLNPGCAMPTVLNGATAKRDVQALVDLFIQLGQLAQVEPSADARLDPLLVDRGRSLYHQVGCIACHEPFDSPQAAYSEPAFSNVLPKSAPAVPFGDLSRKWRIGELAKFLAHPKSVRNHGRMPDLGLAEPDAEAIANFLASKFTPDRDGAHRGEIIPDPSAETLEAGKLIFNERGCAACHTLGEGMGFALPERTKPLAQLDLAHGCLADANLPAHGSAPRYTLTDAQRADLCAAIESASRLVAAPAPIEAAQRIVEEFRCLRCHEKDGRGGVAAELAPYFRMLSEADLGDEGRLPPRLTGVGGRLRSDWMEEVVANGTRARPYLAARMPKFGGDANGGVAKSIATGFAALEGEWRSDSDVARASERKVDPQLATTGRWLVGKEGLNCITCHSFGDRPSAGTPGLDFLAMSKRIRSEFWRRYALAPLRFKPGTRMPIYFVNGRSEAEVLDRDATRQIDAIWAWFERVKELPAPDGVPSGQRMVLDVGAKPRVFRTFLDHAGNRGIAVGTPQGLHFAFDAEQIRLVEAWTGEFLDVAPVWGGRGGHVAPELGPVVWSGPPGPALLLAPREALKGESLDAKVAQTCEAWPSDGGRAHGVKFRGYRLESDGSPTFLYELGEPAAAGAAAAPPVKVEERFTPDGSGGRRFTRQFVVRGLPADRLVMMRAPADAAGPVAVDHGRALAAEHLLFFRSEGAEQPLALHYGVRE